MLISGEGGGAGGVLGPRQARGRGPTWSGGGRLLLPSLFWGPARGVPLSPAAGSRSRGAATFERYHRMIMKDHPCLHFL